MKNNFKKIQKLVQSNISETQDYGGSSLTIIGLCLIIGSIVGLLGYSMNINIFIGIFGIGSILLIDGNNWLIKRRDYLLSEIYAANTFLESTQKGVDQISSALEKIKYIKTLLGRLQNNLWFSKFLYSRSTSGEQEDLISDEIQLLLQYLSDLRSDLSIRLAEQKNLLEGAKSELSENIKGETELESISELQKDRLDRQIEQFEELQRVLVRV